MSVREYHMAKRKPSRKLQVTVDPKCLAKNVEMTVEPLPKEMTVEPLPKEMTLEPLSKEGPVVDTQLARLHRARLRKANRK